MSEFPPAPTVPVFRRLIGPKEFAAAAASLELGWLGRGGYVGEFENALKEFLGAHDPHVVAVSTGHAALDLAVMVAGGGPGDEVITPSFNNIADFQLPLDRGKHALREIQRVGRGNAFVTMGAWRNDAERERLAQVEPDRAHLHAR